MAIDSLKAFEADNGFLITDAAGVFSDASAPTYEAPVGSLHLRTNGQVYKKIAAGTGSDKWSEISAQALSDALTFIQTKLNGFENPLSASLSFNNTNRTLTIAPVSSSFVFYSAGNKFTKTGSETCQLTDTEGKHYFYYDDTGTLTHTTTFTTDLLLTYAYVALVYWCQDIQKALIVERETHGTMDGQVHLWAHTTQGTQLTNAQSGALTVVLGDGSLDADAKLSMSSVSVADEDIRATWTNGNPQTFSPVLNAPVFYRSGASGLWRRKDPNAFPFIESGRAGYTGANGRPAWNQWTGTTWQLTEIEEDECFNVYVFVGLDVYYPVFCLLGVNEYHSVGEAQEDYESELSNILVNGNLPSPEYVLIGFFTVRGSSQYANSVNAKIEHTEDGAGWFDLRFLNITPANVPTVPPDLHFIEVYRNIISSIEAHAGSTVILVDPEIEGDAADIHIHDDGNILIL